MREDQSSKTALGVSIIRTVHQIMDDFPHILDDPISPLLLDSETIGKIKGSPERHRSLQARALRSHVVLRSRYAEDKLRVAVESGIRQFISLGAGYDTFACRLPEWARALKIVEIDHPASQSAKTAHFANRGVAFPRNVAFVPCDLERVNLTEEIKRTEVDLSLPLFISCLGVLAYLKLETVKSLFRELAQMPVGTRFAFAFAPSETASLAYEADKPSASQRAAAQGEPWLTRFKVEDLRHELAESGFGTVSFLQVSEAMERYYADREDLPCPSVVRLCEAVV